MHVAMFAQVQDCVSGLQSLLAEDGKFMADLAAGLADTPAAYKVQAPC